MYLSRFPINRTRRETMRMMASPYRVHAAIAGSFPPEEMPGRVLWRVDKTDDGTAVLYIVSSTVPSLVGLNEQIGWPDMPPQWETRNYDPFLESIRKGSLYTFRLVANPVVNRSSKSSPVRGKRIGHLTALQQAAWLIGREAYKGLDIEIPELFAKQQESRAERNGFSIVCDEASGVPYLTVSDRKKLRFSRGGSGDKITLTTARYDGIIRVDDEDAVRHAMVNGIGHAKGFGCGMLTLAPLRRI